MKKNIIIVLGLFCFACNTPKEENPTPETKVTDSTPAPKLKKELPLLAEMTTSVDNLRLRETPGSDGKELMRLPEKSVVIPTGEKTDLKQVVSLRGLSYNEPWIEVKVDEKITGWLYAGAIDLDPKSSQFAKELFDNRLKRFFGSSKENIDNYRDLFSNIKTAEDLKFAFEKGGEIKDAASVAFQKRCRISELPMDIDLKWIKTAFPGFALLLVHEATEVAFEQDLNQMIEMAELTKETDDDEAFKFLKSINSSFSIRLRFRDWFDQTTDFGGVSRLGSNKHFQHLEAAQSLFDANNIFKDDLIREECNLMVADIVSNKSGYKRGKDAVLAEINKIKDAHFSFLTEEQQQAIENRIRQFDDPKTNKIYLNERVGKY